MEGGVRKKVNSCSEIFDDAGGKRLRPMINIGLGV
jgi:hypothetical protein